MPAVLTMRRLHCEKPEAWHVFARGARRLELFQDPEDFSRFLSILTYSLEKSGCNLWAYALMTNHYHLVLYGTSQQLSSCMRRLGFMYSLYHNKRYGLSGHAFDGPYQAYRQVTPLLTLWKIAYVFLNPVKAGLCARPEDYPWSGYRSFIGVPGSPAAVNISALQPTIDRDPRKAWRLFRTALQAELRRPPKFVTGRLTMMDVHIQQFGWLMEHAEEHPVSIPGIDSQTLAIYWGKKSGISPRAMARALGMENGREVSRVLHALKKRIEEDPHLERLLALP